MRVSASQGRASVTWHDSGPSPANPAIVVVAGVTVQIMEDRDLRDLYECLDFLFGRPKICLPTP